MKKFAVVLTVLSLIAAFPTGAFAYTENYVTQDLSARDGMQLSGNRMPSLIIESSIDFESFENEASFSLYLTNAEWLYEGSGQIESGVYYSVISSTELMITVDTSTFDAVNNNIEIPLYTEIKGSGMSEVTISSINSPVSDGTYTFAHSSFPTMSMDLEASDVDSAFNLTLYDDYPYSMVAGRIFELTLDNGFVFTGEADISGTGKYSGIVNFRVDDNGKTAYIRLDSSTTNATGVIELRNVVIEPTVNSQTGDINISITAINGSDFSKTFPLGSYNKPEESGTANESQPEEGASGAENNENSQNVSDTVRFIVGSDIYYIGTAAYKTDVKPYVNGSGTAMVPLRAAANALGIDDSSIEWTDGDFRGVTITCNGQTVKIPVGDKYIEIDGIRHETDSGAEVVNGRTFLPIRSLANALGISDSDIGWNGSTGEITIEVSAN